MTPRLPTLNGDAGAWDDLINEYLSVEHGADGRHAPAGWLGSGRKHVDYYGAIGDGSPHPLSERYGTLAAAQAVYSFATDLTQQIDWAAITAAFTAVPAGGGVVEFGAGKIYVCNVADHPDNVDYKSCFRIPSKCRVIGNGATVKLLAGSPGMATGITVAIAMPGSLNANEDISIDNLTLDGDAANQTNNQQGLWLRKCTRVRHTRVRVLNCRGTALSGIQETFHFDANACSDVTYTDCEARGTAGSTASGFSCNVSTNIRYTNCSAVVGMTVANGFTDSLSFYVTYVNCWAGKNGYNGFNSEFCPGTSYIGCIGGGRAHGDTGNPPYPLAANESLGNGNHGFMVLGSLRTIISGCVADFNLASGIVWDAGASGRVTGGTRAFENHDWGIYIATASQPLVGIAGPIYASNNPNGDLGLPIGGMVQGGDGGWIINPTPVTPATTTQPTIPASDTALVNPYCIDATAYVVGGTVTAIKVNGRTLGITSGCVRIPAGASITLIYSAAPTWQWVIG